MESNNYTLFLETIEKIRRQTGKTEGEISAEVGRKKQYIAQLKSRMKQGGNVSKKLLESLQLRFAEELKNSINNIAENVDSIEKDDKTGHSKVDESEIYRRINILLEMVIQLQATVNILLITVEHSSAEQRGTEPGLVASQLRQAITIEVSLIADKIRQEMQS